MFLPKKKHILVLNVGSTSIKSRVFSFSGRKEKEIFTWSKNDIDPKNGHQKYFGELLSDLKKNNLFEKINAVGHRVVHGGMIKGSSLIDEKIEKIIKENEKLAPLHNPYNLEGIRTIKSWWPKGVKQVAVFDTSFYKTIPSFASTYPIPLELSKKYQIKKLGFHGISHQYVANVTARLLKKPLFKLNLITIHLGGGGSITAIRNGKAVDTSMGFTPLEGLVMGTRSGDIDPGIIFFLARKIKKSLSEIEKILEHESGIFGLCQAKNMLELIEKYQKKDPAAILAFDVFTYRIKKYIGAYYAILGKCDALVFTGTVGAGRSLTRRKITRTLKNGVLKNTKVLVVKTNEEKMIAEETDRIVKN